MIDLKQLQQSLSDYARPPIEQWNPPFCGDINMLIDRQGTWFYGGSRINRPALVKLFASVLWQDDGDYYLITPAEKVRIQVEDQPFVVTQWQRLENDAIEVTTNTDERYQLSSAFPLIIDNKLPAVKIRDGFLARVHRNVYYQWAEEASPAQAEEPEGFYLQSADSRFLLGSAS